MRPSALRPQQTPPREPELAGPFPPDLHDVRHLWLKAVLLAVWVLASFVATYFARDLQDIVVGEWPLGYWIAAQGAVLVFINFLALRQAVTPEPLLGRMTSTMRWLILIPAGPGALLGGWLGEHAGLRASLAFAGGGALLLALVASRVPVIRDLRELPRPEHPDDWVGAESAGIAAPQTTN